MYLFRSLLRKDVPACLQAVGVHTSKHGADQLPCLDSCVHQEVRVPGQQGAVPRAEVMEQSKVGVDLLRYAPRGTCKGTAANQVHHVHVPLLAAAQVFHTCRSSLPIHVHIHAHNGCIIQWAKILTCKVL